MDTFTNAPARGKLNQPYTHGDTVRVTLSTKHRTGAPLLVVARGLFAEYLGIPYIELPYPRIAVQSVESTWMTWEMTVQQSAAVTAAA